MKKGPVPQDATLPFLVYSRIWKSSKSVREIFQHTIDLCDEVMDNGAIQIYEPFFIVSEGLKQRIVFADGSSRFRSALVGLLLGGSSVD